MISQTVQEFRGINLSRRALTALSQLVLKRQESTMLGEAISRCTIPSVVSSKSSATQSKKTSPGPKVQILAPWTSFSPPSICLTVPKSESAPEDRLRRGFSNSAVDCF